jgi:hypothetical protein
MNNAAHIFEKEVKIKTLTWLVIFDYVKSMDEQRRLATSNIGPASGPRSPTATSEGSLARMVALALDGDDDGASPSSSSSHPPHARLHILPPPHFRQPPSPAVPPLPPPPPALG